MEFNWELGQRIVMTHIPIPKHFLQVQLLTTVRMNLRRNPAVSLPGITEAVRARTREWGRVYRTLVIGVRLWNGSDAFLPKT